MTRAFRQLLLTKEMCLGLREVVRPLAEPQLAVNFCSRLYLSLHALDSDPDLESVDFPVHEGDIMLINHFLSAEDGAWANPLLIQTRQAMFELATGQPAIQLAAQEDSDGLFQDLATPGEMVPERVAEDTEDPVQSE